jgi:hypothetical protein
MRGLARFTIALAAREARFAPIWPMHDASPRGASQPTTPGPGLGMGERGVHHSADTSIFGVIVPKAIGAVREQLETPRKPP